MISAHLQDARWYLGYTLGERAAAEAPVSGRADPALSARRLQQWRARAPLDADDVLTARLATDGLSVERFTELLGAPAEVVKEAFHSPPPWLEALAEAALLTASSSTRQAIASSGSPLGPFVTAVEGLVEHGRKRLAEALEQLSVAPDGPFVPAAAEQMCVTGLVSSLGTMIGRVFVLEMHAARSQGRLGGDTPEARFESFIESLRDPDRTLSLLLDYPVLARQAVSHVDRWVACSAELFRRLRDDFEAIRSTLCSGQHPGKLAAYAPMAGDAHRRGRSVSILTFSSGIKIVYKPRSLAVDVHFQQFLRWLDEAGASPPLGTIAILDQGTHGWTEFVPQEPCTSADEVIRFYRRQGAYLALLYVLEATDVHFENIIARGEYPVLVDVESLFHPRLGELEVASADDLVRRSKMESVLRIGLLPQRAWAHAASEGVDFSGLGTSAGQLSPRAPQVWERIGTDEMHIVRRHVVLQGGANRPTLRDQDVNLLEHGQDIAEGFSCMVRLLRDRRADLLTSGGPLDRFAQDEVRVLLRPTYLYHLLYRESYHPDMLRDSLDRDRFFDRLWVTAKLTPYVVPMIPAERLDLWCDDVPMFTTRPGSSDLWTSTGERHPDFFAASGMSRARQRVEQLDKEDESRQLWFLQAALAGPFPGTAWSPARTPAVEPSGAADRERLLRAATAVADRLEATAVTRAGHASWIGLMPAGGQHWTVGPLGLDLYSGLPGVALFLAYLGVVTNAPRFTSLADAALSTARAKMEGRPATLRSIGAFGDWGGMLYSLSHLGILWRRPELLDEAEALVPYLTDILSKDAPSDILYGVAGTLVSLLALNQVRSSEPALAAATLCGERLLATARTMECGVGWPTPLGPVPLTGFSHGAAGITWALLALSARVGDARFREVALASLAYERRQFSPEALNWPDLREQGTSGGYMAAFCHGAPGVVLGRVLSLPYFDTLEARAEIAIGLKTTLAEGFSGSHCLCHGDLGNLDVLLRAAEATSDPETSKMRNRLAALVVDDIEAHGYRCGTPSAVETPGLMAGLAGIGYGLLRLAAPAQVPSILALDPPRSSR